MRKFTVLIFISMAILTSGCSLKNETIHEPQQESIKEEDILIYQELKEKGFNTERVRESARQSLEHTFDDINKNKQELEEMYGEDEDRFSSIIKEHKKSTQKESVEQ